MPSSALQSAVGSLLLSSFPHADIQENIRPDWLLSSDLTRMELDFLLPEIGIAFEVQGRQHSEFVPFFHGTYDEYTKQVARDDDKVDLCRGAGIRLFRVYTYMDALVAVRGVLSSRGRESSEYSKTPFIPVNKNADTEAAKKLLNYARSEEGHAGATVEQKQREIKQFHKKVGKFFQKGGKGKQKKVPHFKFEYLSPIEQGALLEEYGILELAVNQLSQ